MTLNIAVEAKDWLDDTFMTVGFQSFSREMLSEKEGLKESELWFEKVELKKLSDENDTFGNDQMIILILWVSFGCRLKLLDILVLIDAS